MVWRRRTAQQGVSEEKVEEGGMGGATCIATAVDYREILPSSANACKATLPTLTENTNMSVFGDKLVKINLDQSYGDLVRTWTKSDEGWEKLNVGMEEGCDWITTSLIAKASDTLKSTTAEQVFIILSWYNRRVLAQRPIVNEDRHLTTSLLLRGHKVTYNPLIMVATDTPTTTANWCAQQVRWARATAIETLCYPRMFIMRHPVLFIYSLRRLAVPVVYFAIVTKYLFTGRGSEFSSMQDIGVRIIFCAIYASCHHRNGLKGLVVHAFSQVFLQVPQTAFLFSAVTTMFDSSLGGGFRADKKRSGFFGQQVGGKHFAALLTTLIWTVMVVAAFVRYIATQNTFGIGSVSSVIRT
ncbi:hypothetical protein BDZ85DRAFT_284114 [Elsinoe ampelina]|uniref:Uncharacterized protein n=1 Tax=Elsinoe ampelina TaxID=302913 RepID=A0A6A6G637_9PEZI|nr:hypothetical protein BDZ85DRAFT_284114 [Elsinoe ampelina]